MSVRVHTKRGWLVLASDATHYYENLGTNRPFTTAFHIGQMLDAYRTLERLAPSPRHIVPSHDPYVMKEYPAPKPALEASRAPRCRADRAGADVSGAKGTSHPWARPRNDNGVEL